jgi:hypothetical protein
VVSASNCARACVVEISTSSDGDFTPNRLSKKSNAALVLARAISITFMPYSVEPLLAVA